MRIIDIIKQVEDKKIANKVVPTHAMILEVEKLATNAGYTHEEVNEHLEALKKVGVIEMGRTINNMYIKTIV